MPVSSVSVNKMGLGCQQLFVEYIPKAQSIMARSTQDHIHICLENYLFGITGRTPSNFQKLSHFIVDLLSGLLKRLISLSQHTCG
jgi:hypothetical protein